MSVKRLLELSQMDNIAEVIDDEELDKIGNRVCDIHERDTQSMKGWSEFIEKGMDIAKQDLSPKSHPWPKAANFKSLSMCKAGISFGDKAVIELLEKRDLVKADVIGQDKDGNKQKKANNIAEALNYDINYEMEDWRDEQERNMYIVPMMGATFKKTFFDPTQDRNESSLIQWPNFSINQGSTTFEKAQAFTEILDFSENDVKEKQAAGIWLDVELFDEDEEDDQNQDGSNAEEEAEEEDENPERFLEQHTTWDLDGDGYAEPYLITVHSATKKVVRIVARYDKDTMIIKNKLGKTFNLGKAVHRLQNDAEMSIEEKRARLDEFQESIIVSVKPIQMITMYAFLYPTDGTFLPWGYYHMLTSLTNSINASANMLFNAGALANLQSGFLAKNFRKKMGNMPMQPGVWADTDIDATNLQNGILPLPIKEPSQTLLALNQGLNEEVASFSAVTQLQGVLAPNAPATTTLALLEEIEVPLMAIFGRILRSMGKEFQKLYDLHRRFGDPEKYKEVLDDPDASFKSDFNSLNLDIQPVASGYLASRVRKLQQAEAGLTQFERVLQTGGNPIPLLKDFYSSLSFDVEKLFPEVTPEQQKEQLESLRAQQEQAQAMLELQVAALQGQIAESAAKAETARSKAQLDLLKTQAELQKTAAEIEKMGADIVLTLEKAETEQVTNQINAYTTGVNAKLDELSAIRDLIDADTRRIATANQGQTGVVQ